MIHGQMATGIEGFAENSKKFRRPFATCTRIWYKPIDTLVSVVGVSRIPKHQTQLELAAAIRKSEGMSRLVVYEELRGRRTQKILEDAVFLAETPFGIPHTNFSNELACRIRNTIDPYGYVGDYVNKGLAAGSIVGLAVVGAAIWSGVLHGMRDLEIWTLASVPIGAVIGAAVGYIPGERKERQIVSREHVNGIIDLAAQGTKPIVCVYTARMADAVVKELLARGAVIADENTENRAMDAARQQLARAAVGGQ